jgi:hypothetical protein
VAVAPAIGFLSQVVGGSAALAVLFVADIAFVVTRLRTTS